MFKVNNKDTRMTPLPCSSVFIVNFEQVDPGWVTFCENKKDFKCYVCYYNSLSSANKNLCFIVVKLR